MTNTDIGAQDDGNMCNDANLKPETKGGNNGSSELLENQHDPITADQEPPDKKKRNFITGFLHLIIQHSLNQQQQPMKGKNVLASPGEEGTGKNADIYRKPSKRPLPAHSISPPPPSAPPTNTPTRTMVALSGNQQYKETQNDVNEAPTKKKGDATISIPANKISNYPGQQQGIKDERRERSRVLAQRRRERKKEADAIIKERINQVSKANELLRSKSRALIQELVSLGFDVRTVMSKIAPIPHSKRRRSDTTNGEDYHTIEAPRNNESAESTSNQHQVHQHHQLQRQQHPNHHYQNLLSSYIGRANTGNAFLQSAVPQLSSSPSPLMPHHQQHQQWIHSSAYADQQRRWQQQQAMLLGSASNNGQQNAPTQH